MKDKLSMKRLLFGYLGTAVQFRPPPPIFPVRKNWWTLKRALKTATSGLASVVSTFKLISGKEILVDAAMSSECSAIIAKKYVGCRK